ncbi:MAG: protoporphyrinogen oxidase [Chloroflexi bacterium]|nr:protoporphyrinogen oxidase [Chloroflexota bacterium]
MRVAVVGGGISGLAAAYRLSRSGAEVRLYEAGSRVGGVIGTERRQGYLMEAGPDNFLDKGVMLPLCAELRLTDQLIQVRPEARRSLIARGERLLPIPDGLYLMAPGAIRPFLRSPAVSALGKLRMLLDLALPPRRSAGDESLAGFVRRRLGREALDRLAQPLLGGIYGADPERLSLAATMPQFLEMERKHGSVIRALLARKTADVSGARYGLFHSLRGGMQTLVDALAHALPSPLGAVNNLDHLDADSVCLCIPLPAVARLAPDLPLPTAPYSSVATINFGFPGAAAPKAAGFVVPSIDHRTVMAATFASQKFDGRAPAGRTLVRAFVGGMLGRHALALPDDALIAAALEDVRALSGITDQPEEVWLNRLPDSMPQYEVGHVGAVATLDRSVAGRKLALAGNAYRGVGIPDCISGAFAAADRLLAALG